MKIKSIKTKMLTKEYIATFAIVLLLLAQDINATSAMISIYVKNVNLKIYTNILLSRLTLPLIMEM